jgi:hydrogenase-1 operon protein HyaF
MEWQKKRGTAPRQPCQQAAGVLPGAIAISALLGQIEFALTKLRDAGEETTFDLRSLPIDQPGINQIESLLGRGELQATLEADGPTQIWETAVPAVWWVIHQNRSGGEICRFLQIALQPELLRTPLSELDHVCELLQARIQEASDSERSDDTTELPGQGGEHE